MFKVNDVPHTTIYLIGSEYDFELELKVICLLKKKLLIVPKIKEILLEIDILRGVKLIIKE